MPFAVAPASPADLPAACAVLFPHAGPDALAAAGVDPAGVLAATDRRGAVCGAVLALPLPGALGLVWPPRGDPAAADALAAAAAAHLRAAGVKVGQAFVSPADRPAAAPLERHGFAHVTQLLFFRLPLPAAAGRANPLTLLPATADPPAFRRALLATHADSLDCPEMNAGRTPDELAAGFAPPAGGPDGFWFLAEAAGGPVGVLMLDRGAEPGVTDLVYLGVVPAARGRGYGAALVRAAVAVAAGGGAGELALAVDARNAPAVRVYRGLGFRPHETREVFLTRWV